VFSQCIDHTHFRLTGTHRCGPLETVSRRIQESNDKFGILTDELGGLWLSSMRDSSRLNASYTPIFSDSRVSCGLIVRPSLLGFSSNGARPRVAIRSSAVAQGEPPRSTETGYFLRLTLLTRRFSQGGRRI
jgi:hypothetical protein